MSVGGLGLAALALYLALLAVVAEAARRARRDTSPADHFLAGRGLGAFVLLLTLYATAYSGNSLLGYPGEAYRRGYSWIMATGFMAAIIVVFHVLVPRLRPVAAREGFVTPGDWIRHRFAGSPLEPMLRIAVGIAMTIALANFLLAQLIAMGHVTHEITGGAVPFAAGVVGLALVILVYETIGGMRAVAWTDAAQALLMLFGLAAMLLWLLRAEGGLAGVTAGIAAVRPAAIAVPGARECANWGSSIVLMGIASVVYPQAIQRIYAARSGRDLRISLGLMSFMPFATTTVVTLLGLAAIPRFEKLGRLEADTVMPQILADWAAVGPASAVLAMLVLVAALAAIMSTADSVLLSLASLVAGDLLGGSPRDPATTRTGKRIAVAVMVGMVAVALAPRLTLWRLIELKMELLIQCAPAFLLALHWSRLRAGPTLAGFVVGAAIAAAGAWSGAGRLHGIHVGIVGLALNAAVAGGGSLLVKDRARAVD